MKLKDKCTIFIKNQKPISAIATIILILIVIVSINLLRISDKRKKQIEYSPVMKDTSLRATFVGDIMMSRYVQEYCEKYGYDSVFKNTSNLWEKSDYVSCNVENAIIDNVEDFKANSEKEIKLAAKSDAIKAIKDLGFNIVSLANNHVADYRSKGVINTIKILKEEKIDYVGAGENLEEAQKYNIKEINGIKVATFAISDIIPKGFSAKDDKAGILTTNFEEYPLIVKDAKNNADIVVVYMYWGDEYSHSVSDNQEEIAKNLINSGADIIIGCHQHTLQPVQKYNNGIIFYGVGNFVFDQGFDLTKETTLINFSMDENGNYVFELFPIIINNATPEVTENVYHIKRIFNILTKKLNENDYKIENNKLILEGTFQINKIEEEV